VVVFFAVVTDGEHDDGRFLDHFEKNDISGWAERHDDAAADHPRKRVWPQRKILQYHQSLFDAADGAFRQIRIAFN
jgi:hypothetical protein